MIPSVIDPESFPHIPYLIQSEMLLDTTNFIHYLTRART